MFSIIERKIIKFVVAILTEYGKNMKTAKEINYYASVLALFLGKMLKPKYAELASKEVDKWANKRGITFISAGIGESLKRAIREKEYTVFIDRNGLN